MNTDRTKNKIRGWIAILFIVSFIIYIVHPQEYSKPFVYGCFTLGVTEVILYFISQRKDNYFDFDTIFLFILTICFYVYPVFIYHTSLDYGVFFYSDFNSNRINQAIAISTIAIGTFCLSSLRFDKKCLNVKVYPNYINDKVLTVIFCVLTAYYLLNGGIEMYQVAYMEGLDADAGVNSRLLYQISAINKALFFVLVGTEFYNFHNGYKKKNILFISSIVANSLFMLYAGNRTISSIYLIAFGFYVFYYFKKIKLTVFFALMFFAFVGMYFIQVFRQGAEATSYVGVQALSDFFIPYRMNLVSIDYVSQNSFSWGRNFLGFIGIIPGLDHFLQSLGINTSLIDSAYVFTKYEQGNKITSGLGTTLQADGYLAFGVLGVILIFYMIGRFSKQVFLKFQAGSYYHFIIYAVFVGHAVFWVRTGIMYIANPLVWSLMIAYINYRLQYGKRTVTTKRWVQT